MSFKIDTDEDTNDYQSVWLALFPPLWTEKRGVDGSLLEKWCPVSDVSCIYNCKEESLRVALNYKTILYAPTAPNFPPPAHQGSFPGQEEQRSYVSNATMQHSHQIKIKKLGSLFLFF